MKTLMVVGGLVALMYLGLSVPVLAASSADEASLSADTESLDQAGAKPNGGAAVVQTIKNLFLVSDSQVSALRDEGLGYGEIVVVLALAQATTAGITPDSIAQVLALRQGPPVKGWGQVASSMGLGLGAVLKSVAKARHSSSQAEGGSIYPPPKGDNPKGKDGSWDGVSGGSAGSGGNLHGAASGSGSGHDGTPAVGGGSGRGKRGGKSR